jgi:hypothetical protein
VTSVVVRGLGIWAPGFDAVDRWAAQDADPDVVRPRSPLLAGAAARRASPLTQAIAHVLGQACAEADLPPADVAVVLASAGGELDATFACLRAMLEAPPASSPLRFANSLHSSPLGHVSVALGARGFGAALAAPADTLVAMGLLEATTWVVTHRQPTVLVVADDAWPHAPSPLVAVGVLLVPEGAGRGRLGVPTRAPGTLSPSVRGGVLRASPAAGALELLDALLGGAGVIGLSPAEGATPGWSAAWSPT